MALALPPNFAAVGVRNGRQQVTNRGQDQSFVFAMLKAIPEAQGGAAQQLAGESVPILGNGTCSDFLAGLILRFQRNAGGSMDGVVDHGGNTLRLMMKRSGAQGSIPAGPAGGGGAGQTHEAALPAQRQRLLQACRSVLVPTQGGPRKPAADELRGFFATARTEAVPTLAEAQRSLQTLSSGCYIQGSSVRHWCGIFACTVAISAGLSTLRWSLMGGNLLGAPKIWGHQGLLPGDIAVIAAYSHHFLITGCPGGGQVDTLEGNTTGQLIRASRRAADSIVAFYRLVPV